MPKAIVESRKTLNTLTTIFVFSFVLLFGLSALTDPSFFDHGPSKNEPKLWQMILSSIAALSCFTVIFSAIRHALRKERGWWAFAIFLAWPLAFYYGYNIIEKDE